MKIVVTGANGFLGSHIVRVLSRNGHQVKAVIRQGSSSKYIDRYQAKIISVDYNNLSNYAQEIFEDCDLFIHNAAKVCDWGKYEDFQKTNVNLVQTVYELAAQNGVKKIIQISSNAVMGEEDNLTLKNEESPYKPTINYLFEKLLPSGMNHYKKSKALGEQKAKELATKYQLDLTILRPVWIFGPREFNAGPYEYCQAVIDGVPAMPGTSKNLFHTVYVEDVARAVLAAVSHAPKGIKTYNIGPKEVPHMHDFYLLFCQQLKKKKPFFLPNWLLILPVTILEAVYLALKTKKPPLLTRGRLYMMYANNLYDVTKAEKELSFVANTDFKHAVRKTVKWWRLTRNI